MVTIRVTNKATEENPSLQIDAIIKVDSIDKDFDNIVVYDIERTNDFAKTQGFDDIVPNKTTLSELLLLAFSKDCEVFWQDGKESGEFDELPDSFLKLKVRCVNSDKLTVSIDNVSVPLNVDLKYPKSTHIIDEGDPENEEDDEIIINMKETLNVKLKTVSSAWKIKAVYLNDEAIHVFDENKPTILDFDFNTTDNADENNVIRIELEFEQ